MTHNSTVFPLVTLGKGGPLHFLISRKTGNENKQATTDSYNEGDRLQRAEYHQLF